MKEDVEENKGFDLRVHINDPKTGRLVKFQPYSYTVSQEHGAWFTRDGIRYAPNGDRLDPEPAKAPAQMEKGKAHVESKITK